MHPYYADRMKSIAGEFDANLHAARRWFEELVPDVRFDDVVTAVHEVLPHVVATLPYVGGAHGRMTPYFEQTAGVFALGRVLRARGIPEAMMSQLLRHVFLARLRETPRHERLALGRRFLSAEGREMLRHEAEKSRLRENGGDFVYRFVEPSAAIDGESFEFGLDYVECGFCKLAAANADTDILPMICDMDVESYALRGVELKRSSALAGGASCCDFRYAELDDSLVP